MNRETKKDIELFSLLVSEINISKYNQKEYREIVEAIYCNIFYSLNPSNHIREIAERGGQDEE